MSFAIASDHAGFELKKKIIKFLKDRGEEVIDLGTNGKSSVDYPDFGARVAQKLSSKEVDKGILVCGSGIGMSIVANKFPGVRAAVVVNEFMAKMAKEHNDANILCIPARIVDMDTALKLIQIWLTAIFEGGRHKRRLDKITKIEKQIYDIYSK